MQLAEAFLRSGKVRDLFELPNHRILLVASDRISAFDVVLPNVVPDKGRVLTGLSRFWFAETKGIVRNHLLDTVPDVIRDTFVVELENQDLTEDERERLTHEFGSLEDLRGRIMVCRPATVLPVEAVVRGYLAGSGWKEYRDRGTVCGIRLPAGLREGDRLPEPIFTPATKAEAGSHDENVSFDGMIEHLKASWPLGDMGDVAALAERVRDAAIALYRFGAAVVERKGMLLADTKFEFGIPFTGDDEPVGPLEERVARRPLGARMENIPGGSLASLVMLIDEALTPDSSRFWDAAAYAPGGPQASFDKQFVRDWLESQPWDKTAPGPELPANIVAGTRARYVEAYERITGASFERYLREDVIGP